MPKRFIGPIILLVASVILGMAAGEVFYKLCLQVVPVALLTEFNKGAARVAFSTYGIGLGVVIFGWSLAAVAIQRVFGRGRGRAAEAGKKEGSGR